MRIPATGHDTYQLELTEPEKRELEQLARSLSDPKEVWKVLYGFEEEDEVRNWRILLHRHGYTEAAAALASYRPVRQGDYYQDKHVFDKRMRLDPDSPVVERAA